MTEIRSLCVLCGSREGNDPAYREAAIRLGTLMARRGVRLVYGGGSIGLMGVIADAVLAAGGEAIGVIPDFLIRYEVSHRRLTELVITGSMHDRKRQMFEMADAFVVLPGGLGTLDETFEIVTWKQIRLHDSPIVVLDVDGYWTPLKALMEATIAAGFAHESAAELVSFVRTPEEVLQVLAAAPTPKEEVVTSHL
ncbi:MAG: TIGR00730 family Rossman fold protein [Rhodospirillales bacterium]